MKRNFWTKLGLLSLACGLFLTAPAAIINADDTTPKNQYRHFELRQQ